jgi:CheY-like chemotaxis protein
VSGYPSQLKQVLSSLLNNAVKFTPTGKIEISVSKNFNSQKNLELLFCIADTGIGIPEDKKKAIFNPFFQVNSSFSREYGGLGLGLNICDGLIKKMGGKIWVTSELGKGSQFYFTISLQLPQKNADTSAFFPSTIKKNLPLLLIQEEPTSRYLISIVLKKQGYEVIEIDKTKQAIGLVQKQNFQLILLDLPPLEPFSLSEIRELRSVIKSKAISIVGMTENGMDESPEFLSVGVDIFLPKPVRKNELLELICMLTDHSSC